MPEGRPSSTRFKTCLYSATAPVEASRGRRISAMERDRRLEAAEGRRCHRELLQAALYECGNVTSVAVHVSAEADRGAGPSSMRDNARDELHHRRVEGIG